MDIRLLIGGYLYITIAVIFIIYILKRIIKKEGFTAIDKALPIIIFGTGFLYIIALAFHYSEEIGLSDKLQILLMFGLVAVTTFYAWSASRQADANVKMAKRMEKQKYDVVRPVIDIQRNIEFRDLERQTLEANAALLDDISHGLTCILHNVGVGPAIDTFSFIEHPEKGRLSWDFGPIVMNRKTEIMPLALKHEGNRMALVAYYKDVYDNWFESSREVRIEKTPNPNWVVGHLEIRPIKEEELPRD